MSDLSDLTALPDGLREAAAKQAVAYARMLELGGGVGLLGQQMFEDMLAWDELTSDHHADTVLALFAELDGLRAQIEEAREALSASTYDLGFFDNMAGQNAANLKRVQDVRSILAQSPRGTVARIQSEALEAFKATTNNWDDPWSVNGFRDALDREAAALREGAGQ